MRLYGAYLQRRVGRYSCTVFFHVPLRLSYSPDSCTRYEGPSNPSSFDFFSSETVKLRRMLKNIRQETILADI